MKLKVEDIFTMSWGQTFIIVLSESKNSDLLPLPNKWRLVVNGENKEIFTILGEQFPFFKDNRWYRTLITNTKINKSNINFYNDDVVLILENPFGKDIL